MVRGYRLAGRKGSSVTMFARCHYCSAAVYPTAAAHADQDRKFCSEGCYRAWYELEQAAVHCAVGQCPNAADRVGSDHGPARRWGGGPTMR